MEADASLFVLSSAIPEVAPVHAGPFWCGWRGSNPRPLALEANTLSTELQPHGHHCSELSHGLHAQHCIASYAKGGPL